MAISMHVRRYGAAPGDWQAEGTLPWTPPHELLSARETPLLVGVDPYDDTVFNRSQCAQQILPEVVYLRALILEPDQTAMLDALDRLPEEATRSPHRCLVFNGD